VLETGLVGVGTEMKRKFKEDGEKPGIDPIKLAIEEEV